MAGRVPTFLFNVDGVPAADAAQRLAERGLGVWYADNWYCVALGPRLPEQSLRAGIAHYNTEAEVDRLLAELQKLSSSAAS
jgi:selenocysteine lyase/cysteine desulfurase